MPGISLGNALGQEYQHLFDTCEISSARQAAVEKLIRTILANKDRYRAAGRSLSIPWFFIASIHNMESSLRFDCHLHNGDPLTARTVQVPSGRPKTGAPPFTWEESATDALKLRRLDRVSEWTIPAILFQFERYNGFGYRNQHPDVLSPYLWSFSNHYSKGKFTGDHKFDPDAVSQQCGAAVLLRRMAETGAVQFNEDGTPKADFADTRQPRLTDLEPLVTYALTRQSDEARMLQRALNAFPGIFVRVDGVPSQLTSDAFFKVTGHFLKGDPRA